MIPRWHETAGNKEKHGENDEEIKKEETENTTKAATILWRFLLAIFHCKSRCRKRSSGETVTKKVTEASEKVTEK